MRPMTDMLQTDVWLTLDPRWRRSGDDMSASGFTVVKATKNRPEGTSPVVKLRLRLPAAAFAPLAPTVTIEVPEEGISFPEPIIEVDLGDRANLQGDPA